MFVVQSLPAARESRPRGTENRIGQPVQAVADDAVFPLHAVSFVADWQFAKKFDAYAGIMFSQVNGGLANGYLTRNAIDPTVGLRFRF